jgi:hypothetical protein
MIADTTTTVKVISLPDGGLDINVQSEITSHDELVTVLLMVIESMTDVPTDSYVQEVDAIRALP